MSPPSATESGRASAPRRWPIYVGLAALCLIVLAYWSYHALIPRYVARARELRAREMLASSDPQERKKGAWVISGGTNTALAHEMIIPRLERGAESDPDVREALVYALGRIEDPAALPILERVVRQDPAGYVRAAAWLAIARIDAERFRELAGTTSNDDTWDRIGEAQAWLSTGDYRGADTLLAAAESGDHSQAVVAERALYKAVRPVLDAVGRWPLDADVEEGEAWPAELVAEVRRRAARLDLQEIADDSRKHFDAAAPVRRNVARLLGARERIARLLISD